MGVDEGGEGLKDYEGAFLPPKDDPKYDLPPVEDEIFGKSQGWEQEVDAGELEPWMLLNATAKTESRPLPTVSPTVLEEMWGQPGLDIPPVSGA